MKMGELSKGLKFGPKAKIPVVKSVKANLDDDIKVLGLSYFAHAALRGLKVTKVSDLLESVEKGRLRKMSGIGHTYYKEVVVALTNSGLYKEPSKETKRGKHIPNSRHK